MKRIEYEWFNEPKEFKIEDNKIVIKTSPFTDFWQKTHYGFSKDNGHCYITEVNNDFTFTALLDFSYNNLYDQCGLILRIDENNWIKASMEYENDKISRLGSVVTNLGYSDWATTDISSDIKKMWYRINKTSNDILIENSNDGINWTQMRLLHIHKECNEIKVGIYACSPKDSSFTCKASNLTLNKKG